MGIMDELGLRSILSQNIKRLRKRKGFSQEILAEKMGISTNYLSDIEREKNWPSPLSLVKLANALEVEVFELFKPQEAVSSDISNAVNRCLEDLSSSLKISFEKSLNDSIKGIQRNL